MKKCLIFATAILLLIFITAIASADQVNLQEKDTLRNFQKKPLTEGIYEETAYTLQPGGLKIGDLSLPFYRDQWRTAYLEYGLSHNFQLGTTVANNFLGNPNLTAKYSLPFKGFWEAELAIPASITMQLDPLGVSTQTGLVASWKVNDTLNLHAGTNVWVVSYAYGYFFPSAYLITDYNLHSNIKLISELDFHSFGSDYLSIRIGGLLRILNFINLKLRSTVDIPYGGLTAGADLFLRF